MYSIVNIFKLNVTRPITDSYFFTFNVNDINFERWIDNVPHPISAYLYLRLCMNLMLYNHYNSEMQIFIHISKANSFISRDIKAHCWADK